MHLSENPPKPKLKQIKHEKSGQRRGRRDLGKGEGKRLEGADDQARLLQCRKLRRALINPVASSSYKVRVILFDLEIQNNCFNLPVANNF